MTLDPFHIDRNVYNTIGQKCPDDKVYGERRGLGKMEELQILIAHELDLMQEGPASFKRNDNVCLVLVKIIANTEDLTTCILAVEILTKLLTKASDAEREKAVKLLTVPCNYSKVFETLQLVHLKHFKNRQDAAFLKELHLKLLRLLECLYTKRPRSQYSCVSRETVRYFACLMAAYKESKEHCSVLFTIARHICLTKRFCDVLGTKSFFDNLNKITMLTHDVESAMKIIKCMNKCPEAMNEMKYSENLVPLISSLINSNIGTRTMKRQLIAVLYKVVKKVPDKLSNPSVWSNLLDFFKSSDKLHEKSLHMAVIKIYTLLNLASKRKIIATKSLPYHHSLPVEPTNDRDSEFEDSENENEDTEEEEEDTDEQNERKSDIRNRDESENEEDCPAEKICDDASEMKHFFAELLPEYQSARNSSFPERFRISVDGNVVRPRYCKGHAYPDSIFVETATQESPRISSSTYQFDVFDLVKRLRNINSETKVEVPSVYDLDELIQKDLEGADQCFSEDYKENLDEMRAYYQLQIDNLQRHSKNRVADNNRVLKFESRFESGNLRSAEQIGDFEYNLFLTPDVHTFKGRQWFYFRVTNMIANTPYVFNIVNFDKINSQFNYGMQPVMFSTANYLLNRCGWRRTGQKIIYYGNNYTSEDQTKQYRTLRFSVTFEFDNDICYLAYHYPYTYTRLVTHLLQLVNGNKERIYTRLDNLCHTINGNPVPLLTVTGAWNQQNSLRIPYDKRPIVFLAARVHPGESNSSWIMDGVLKFLLDDQSEEAEMAREHYIFKIVPMLNPEGVIFGNTRSGPTGCDLNRCWKNPSKSLHPEIYYAKKMVQFAKNKLNHPVTAFIDIHGHSRKKYYFFYGCNPYLSWNKEDKMFTNSGSHQIIPEELSFDENMKSSFCQYKIDKKKETTCRVVMWREFGIKGSLTLECSYCSGEHKKKMTTTMLQSIGRNLITSLANIASRVSSSAGTLPDLGFNYSYANDPQLLTRLFQNTPSPLTSTILSEDSDEPMIFSFAHKYWSRVVDQKRCQL